MKNLIIIIDLWEKTINDIKSLNTKYADFKVNNILKLLSRVKDNINFDFCNANYCDTRCSNNSECRCANHGRKILQDVIDMNINFKNMNSINPSLYDNVYLLGLSFDGCIINRSLGFLNIKHTNKFVIKDCCLNENPIRGDLQNKYFSQSENKEDVIISNVCPQKWLKNGRIEWPGPYYYFKNTDAILKYEDFIVQTMKLRVIDSTEKLD